MLKSFKKRIFSFMAAAVMAVTNTLPTAPLRVFSEEITTNAETVTEDSGLVMQTLEVSPDEENSDTLIMLEGMMPEDAEASAVDVSEDYEGIAAYDITITSGEGEFQPDEENPIRVEIAAPVITETEGLQLWHIRDDGEREQIMDFTAEDGRIFFYAEGFSVYQLVKDTNVKSFAESSFFDVLNERGEEGFYVSFLFGGKSQPGVEPGVADNGQFYIKKDSMSISGQGQRKGISLITPKNTNNGAVKLYFENVENEKGSYYLYIKDGDTKKYIKMFTGSDFVNPLRSALDYTTDDKEKTKFVLDHASSNDNQYKIYATLSDNKKHYWVVDNKNSPKSIVGYGSEGDVNSAWITIHDFSTIDDDPYHLDGKTYALMNYNGGTSGNGMLARGDTVTAENLLSWVVRVKQNNGSVSPQTLYVPEDDGDDISLWTFGCIAEDNYTLSTVVNGEVRYLIINGDGTLTLGDETAAKANPIKVTPDPTNPKEEKDKTYTRIMLTANDKSVTFDNGGFTAGDGTYLNLVDISNIANEDSVTYSAKKVSVSEVQNKQDIIIYTRVWNESAKNYEFYAIDHAGNLIPCYERGDNIMWVGGRINTLLWEFTEYYWEGTTDPNYYYELYNPYSRKYIAPVKTTGQVLSDETIGINLPGRKEGEYYSDILAWDDLSYSYASLKAQVASNIAESCIVPGSRANAETFYFARVVDPEKDLTPVDTIDNEKYGIEMKMIDFNGEVKNYDGGSTYTSKDQHDVIGYSTFNASPQKSGLLTNYLAKETVEGTADVEGYPSATITGKSLSELFGSATEVNNLFIESTYEATGYFEYDSCQNFATLINNKGTVGDKFTVYKELGTRDGDTGYTMKHGQFFPYDNITAGNYSKDNPENLYTAFARRGAANTGLLPDSDPRKYEKLLTVGSNPDYYFGMELSAGFTQTPSGKDNWGHDIIFEFTGDDDFWLYVDGELVIDLGGIHSALSGNVNFATGEVNVNGKKTNLRDIFIANYKSRGMTDDEINTELAKRFDYDSQKGEYEKVFKDYSSHEMKIFYMERGAGASNLHMRFNLSYVTPGHVVLDKEVTGTNDMDYDLVEFPYQIWYKDNEATGEEKLLSNVDEHISVTYQNSTKKVEYLPSYTPPGSTKSYQSVFLINPQKSAEIHFPANTIQYRIIECGINSDVYDHVFVNDHEKNREPIGDTGRCTVDSGWMEVSERTSVTFQNHVDPDGLRTLSFQKKLYDNDYEKSMSAEDKEAHKITHEQLNPAQDKEKTTFTFRLYLSDGATEEMTLANMYKYYVIDPDGYYCRWSMEARDFVSTSLSKAALDAELLAIDNNEELNEEQKLAQKAGITAQIPEFETSMNGSISKIPAWYTVLVPYIPAGTKFKVEERDSDSERPLGYDRVEYERIEGTYTFVAGGAENEGWVKKEESPKMNVINQRGFEIEAQKIWSDKDFCRTHAPVYTALYYKADENAEEELVPGTVRKITDDEPYVRYFMNTLPAGKTLANYAVYEVEVSDDAVFDEEGKMTDGSISKKLENGLVTNNNLHSYSVSYDKGSVKTETINGKDYSARKDSITNDRSGGVVISLYDMKLVKTGENTYSKTPLANGVFTLYKGRSNGGTKLGIFTSNSNGKITIMYDYELDTEYELVEDTPPDHYIGLPRTVRFKLKSNTDASNVTTYSVEFYDETTDTWKDVKDNPDEQRSEYKYDEWLGWNEPAATGDQLVAYINVYNKKFTLKAEKQDFKDNSKKLEGAHFALYRGVSGVGGLVKDYDPIPGYNDLVTDENGIIPMIDNTLEPGKYYLEEVTPPTGYKKLKEDVIFTIKKDDIVLNNQDSCFHLETTETDEHACVIRICNELDDSDLYFDIEKIIFTDKNIHNGDDEQKFVFRVDRFEETDTAMTGACDSFFVTLNCDKDMTYNSDEDIKVDGAKYNFTMFHTAADGYSFSGSGDNVTITRTYNNNGKTENYTFPTAIRTGRQTIHVKKGGIYRISEVTGWSGTDYVLWKGSNVYKGYGTPISQGGDDGCVVFSTAAVKAEKFKEASAQIDGKYRPTASFTNTETEFAYLTSQSYAENIIGRSGSQGAAP